MGGNYSSFVYFLRFVMNLSAENMKKSQIMTSRTLQPHQQIIDNTPTSPMKTPEPLVRSADVLPRIYTALKVGVNIFSFDPSNWVIYWGFDFEFLA